MTDHESIASLGIVSISHTTTLIRNSHFHSHSHSRSLALRFFHGISNVLLSRNISDSIIQTSHINHTSPSSSVNHFHFMDEHPFRFNVPIPISSPPLTPSAPIQLGCVVSCLEPSHILTHSRGHPSSARTFASLPITRVLHHGHSFSSQSSVFSIPFSCVD